MTYPVQRVTVVTLGVRNVARSRKFYETLGWTPSEATPAVVFFQMHGTALCLFGLKDLATDQGRPEVSLGMGGVTLAQNMASPADVDTAYAEAVAAGAAPIKPPAKAYWGGYHGFYADPDGHVWELAYNPFWALAEDGALTLPQPA